MANRYLDHGAYGTYVASPNTSELWGKPQEGDGLAKAASTASAIASIAFSAVPTSGTITVMGVTITLTNVLSQANVDTSANNLASSINAMATAVASGISVTVPQLRNLVFARGPAGGAPAGTCQIMTRVGAVSLNVANNGACVINPTFNNVSSSGAAHQFSGAVSGCYGYWTNELGTVFPQALSTCAYGMFAATQRPLAGYPLAGDKLKVRSNKTLTQVSAVNNNMSMHSGGTATQPVLVEFDDGTEWPADGVDPKFIWIARVDTGGQLMYGSGVGVSIWRGKRYSDGSNNVIFGVNGTSTSGVALALGSSTPLIRYENITWDAATYSNLGGSPGIQIGSGGSNQTAANAHASYRGCKFWHKKSTSYIAVGINTNVFNFNFEDCVFSNDGATVKNDGILSWPQANAVLHMTGVKFEGFVVGSVLFTGGLGILGAATTNVLAQLYLKDTSWGNVTARGPFGPASSNPTLIPYSHMIFAGSSIETEDMLLDTKQGSIEWNASRSQPTLNAKLQDGVTPMSYRFVPTTSANNVSFMVPFEIPRLIKFNELADGARTFTIEFCLEQALAWDKGLIWAVIEYTDVNGVAQTLDSWGFDRGALTTSTATWSSEVAGQVTFVDGGLLYHNKYKIVLSTPAGKNLKQGTEVGVTVKMCGTAGNLTQGGFICPEVLVT